jgi:hypothetical protein
MLWIVTFQFEPVIALGNGTWNLYVHKWSSTGSTSQIVSTNNRFHKKSSAKIKQNRKKKMCSAL